MKQFLPILKFYTRNFTSSAKDHFSYQFTRIKGANMFFLVAGVPLAASIISTGVVCTFYTTLVSTVHTVLWTLFIPYNSQHCDSNITECGV